MSKKNTRKAERAFAFQALYALSFSPAQDMEGVRKVFQNSPDFEQGDGDGFQSFAFELVAGVWRHEKELDALVEQFSRNWRISRMGRIELIILRMGIYEMIFRQDIPAKVAKNQAMELSQQFGEESARSFVKGILEATEKALQNGEIKHR